MRTLTLFLILCFLITLNCNGKDVLICAIGKLTNAKAESVYNALINKSYSALTSIKSSLESAIDQCLYKY